MRFFAFLKKRFFYKILGAILIGIATYYSSTLTSPKNDIVIGILSVFTAVFFLFFDTIADEVDKLKYKKKKISIICNHLNAFNKFIQNHLGVSLNIQPTSKEIEQLEIDYNRREVIYIEAIKYLKGFNEVQIDSILLTSICNEINNETDVLKIDNYKSVVVKVFEKYNLLEPDEEARVLIDFCYNFSKNKKLNDPTKGINYSEFTNSFTKKYNKTFNLTLQMKLEKDQAEEFRTTLAVLISTGKLSIRQLEKKLQDKINQDISSKTKRSKAFLVLANRFHKYSEVEKVLNKFPFVAFPGKYSKGLPESIKYLHTRIIYPPDNYQNALEFLNKEIKPKIPDEKLNDGFIAIIPIEGTELYSIPENADNIRYSYMKEGFESITAYKTGVSIDLTELFIESLQNEINIDEILSIIPFNIFVPGISNNIRNFIINNYDELKTHFNITRLGDWATINKDDLRDFLINIDTNREKRRLYIDENWDSLAAKIIDQSIKHQRAIQN